MSSNDNKPTRKTTCGTCRELVEIPANERVGRCPSCGVAWRKHGESEAEFVQRTDPHQGNMPPQLAAGVAGGGCFMVGFGILSVMMTIWYLGFVFGC